MSNSYKVYTLAVDGRYC